MAEQRDGISTSYWQKPIPDRNFDWEAWWGAWDLGKDIGYGATEEKAIADLISHE